MLSQVTIIDFRSIFSHFLKGPANSYIFTFILSLKSIYPTIINPQILTFGAYFYIYCNSLIDDKMEVILWEATHICSPAFYSTLHGITQGLFFFLLIFTSKNSQSDTSNTFASIFCFLSPGSRQGVERRWKKDTKSICKQQWHYTPSSLIPQLLGCTTLSCVVRFCSIILPASSPMVMPPLGKLTLSVWGWF